MAVEAAPHRVRDGTDPDRNHLARRASVAYPALKNSRRGVKMLESGQAIMNAIGVTVFGSATNRVQPDLVSIRGSVSCVEQKPADAFSKARQTAASVQSYLSRLKIAEFGVSRAALNRQVQYVQGGQKFAGYQAWISFRISSKELDRADEIAEGLVNAGMNEIESFSFETSKLKEERAKARRMAVDAAIEKAQIYCSAAGVALGRVIRIEDTNPMRVQNEMGRGHHALPTDDDDGDGGPLDPSLIEISGAVFVTFEIRQQG
jgi:uncharacterized protein YggE